MRGKVTWLITAAVAAVVIVGVVDALRGSPSHQESAAAAPAPTVVDLGGSSLTLESGIAQTTTEPVAEPVATTTAPAIKSPTPERLPLCTTPQLALAMKVVDGSAMLVLRRVAGKPCHHGRSSIGLTVRDQYGHSVTMFGGSPDIRSTASVDFSQGFVQLMQIPYTMSCDPTGSYLAVATVAPYEARRTVSGTEIACNHS